MRKTLVIISVLLVAVFVTFLVKSPAQRELQFSDIVKGDVTKLTLHESGSGLLYETTDQSQVNRFVNMLSTTKYKEVKPKPPAQGASTITLYDKQDRPVASIKDQVTEIVINDVYYEMTNNIQKELGAFYKEFLVEKNIVNH